jgi:CYTH domain-containing protein
MIERERKFLVIESDEFNDSLPFSGEFIVQIYIVDREDHSLRIRIINNETASICYKYYLDAESKEEHEYPFPLDEATRILGNSEYTSFLAKMRYKKDGWDIDNYPDFNITVAEYEFSDDNPLPDPLPSWIGEEVTGQYEYTNPAIAKRYTENK